MPLGANSSDTLRRGNVLLDEAVLSDQLAESILGDEVVVNTVALTVARGAGGMRHGESELLGVTGEEHVDQGALSDTARARDNDGTTV